MSDASNWTLDRERLVEALERWRCLRPDASSVDHVNDFLMDVGRRDRVKRLDPAGDSGVDI